MMEVVLRDYAALIARDASPVAFESLFRHAFIMERDPSLDDDMLWFVRSSTPSSSASQQSFNNNGSLNYNSSFGAAAATGSFAGSFASVGNSGSNGSNKASISSNNVFVRRHVAGGVGSGLDEDVDSAAIDWPRTLGLNIVVHWRYELVVAVVPQRRALPGKGMIVKEHVRHAVYAAPSKSLCRHDPKLAQYELDFPNIYFNVEDFETVFGGMSLPRMHGLAVMLEAVPGIPLFKGVLTFDQISSTFEKKAQGIRMGRTEFVPLVGPSKKGKAEMAVTVVEPVACSPSTPSPRDDTALQEGSTISNISSSASFATARSTTSSFLLTAMMRDPRPSIMCPQTGLFELSCGITYVSVDFMAMSMQLLQVVEDTYSPPPPFLYFPPYPLSDEDAAMLEPPTPASPPGGGANSPQAAPNNSDSKKSDPQLSVFDRLANVFRK
eukprot:PhM_4_TR4907/c0_g1_i1/m.45022